MTGVDVEHTKALEAAATPGPWLYCTKTYDGMPLVVAEGYGFPAEPMRQTRGIVCHPEADAEFIAHARTAVPALVAAVEQAQALADDLESRAAAIEEANPTHTTQIALHRQHAAMIRQALETPS